VSGFEWLGELANFVRSLFPQLAVVKQTHCAVKFVRGSKVKELKPGLHVYWPCVTEYLEMPRVRQTVNLATQVILTHERKPVATSGIVVYEVADAVKALSKSFDVEDTIGDVALTAVATVISTHTLAELTVLLREGDLTTELTKACRARLYQFGIKVKVCALTDLSTTQVVTLLGQAHGQPLPAPEE
jgi:regulator of protease activity HflC (stomatin/prohibitin superfamily)